MNNLISIIMPAYNVENYIDEAIDSVIEQSHENWELLIINNNSRDSTIDKITKYTDPRIKLFTENNQGVGFARNLGLTNMNGDYFCFLDADDVLPENALSARLKVFQEKAEIDFVDGSVDYVNESLEKQPKKYVPNFKGKLYHQLLTLNSNCIFGNTWMIKRDFKEKYKFQTDMTHSEDLFFYLTISKGKYYDYTSETVLLYRQRSDSAMKNIKGLESGYIQFIKKIRAKLGEYGWSIIRLKLIITKIMILSHLFDGRDFVSAIKSPFKILSA